MGFRILKGLPPYGPMAKPFPERFGRTGREGFVVEFLPEESEKWVGNFEPGYSKYSGAHCLPQSDNVLVVAGGHAYFVDVRSGSLLADKEWVAEDLWEVSEPDGFVINRQGVAFFRLGASGVIWHTRRLALDGFMNLVISTSRLEGLASTPDDWVPFEVNLHSGVSVGGFLLGDFEGWEQLASE